MTISFEAPRLTYSLPSDVLPFAFLSACKKVIKNKAIEIMQILFINILSEATVLNKWNRNVLQYTFIKDCISNRLNKASQMCLLSAETSLGKRYFQQGWAVTVPIISIQQKACGNKLHPPSVNPGPEVPKQVCGGAGTSGTWAVHVHHPHNSAVIFPHPWSDNVRHEMLRPKLTADWRPATSILSLVRTYLKEKMG